ncbi:hypothetical protein CERSUDRAFT_125476 [Gelatoporia subvermispora B]|uniref:NACHT domain-containing protein n=1 Tax=Ceriporiopsis subvermispora (strain B) TaxID=914234 RepID=M2R5V5_CERS8|nr:hypothetical protein CERSUDRAFT_125476 [Gelatoporia subvermispora B]
MAICVASSCTAISLHTGQPTVTSDSASAPPSPSTHRAEPSSQVKQSIQDRAQSPAFSASVAPVDIARLWKDALNEYTGQTGADLTTDPLMIRLNECDKVEEIMDILQERTKAFGEFRNGDAKVQLLRTLSPIVTAVLALGPSETLGEGFSVVCPPANAIVGAIAVLLKATKDVSTSYDSLVELLNGISKFLERLALYGRMSLTVPMREILIKTLATVISILALATKEVELGRLKKYVRTLLGSTEVEDALKQLTRLDSAETQMIGLESLRLTYSLAVGLDELMKNGKQSTAEIKAAFENMQSSMTATGQLILELKHDSDVQKHHTWLSPPDPSVNHHLTSRSYSTGTCAWFIDGQVMGEWKTTSSLLWIHGIPGSGKSVLCTAIIEDIKRLCLIQQKSILVYFYCDFQDAAKQNVRGLLSHLLVQFSAESQYCNQLLSRLWSSHRSGSQQPSEDDLRQCLKRMLEHLADHYLYIIIDALDECPSAGLRSHRKDVLDLIQTIIGWRCRNVHMCVTSRPELDIREALDVLSPRSVSLHAEDGQADEISAYVRSVIESGPVYQRWKVQDKKLAIERLSEKANGMFRWAFCQLEMLRGCHPATIRKVLDDLPETLDETYRRELQKLDIPSWEYTHRLFQCLVVFLDDRDRCGDEDSPIRPFLGAGISRVAASRG